MQQEQEIFGSFYKIAENEKKKGGDHEESNVFARDAGKA